MNKKPVIMIQDGAVDELMSIFLVQSMPEVDLLGIVVVNGDCLGEPTMKVSKKILQLIGTPEVPVALSNSRAVNAFPWIYRQYSMMVNLLPMLNYKGQFVGPLQPLAGAQLIVKLINDARSQGKPKVTILGLSPMTPLLDAYGIDHSIADFIDQIVWMGGALKPENGNDYPFGNVDPGLAPGANPNAEWNAFWDPFAVRDIWEVFTKQEAQIPFIMFPLNATNSVMLGPEFILKLAPQSREYPVYDLAAQMYAMVAFQAGYAFWDTVTTAYLGNPGLFTTGSESLNIVTTGPDQGLIFKDTDGFPVTKVTDVQVQDFYSYLLEQWKIQLPGL